MDINVKLNISVNSGAALFLFLAAFFGLVAFAASSDKIIQVFAIALTGLTVAFGGYLKKRDRNNVLDLEAEKLKLGTPQ